MPATDYYEIGSMSDDEIVGAENEEVLTAKIREMTVINDGLYAALAAYKSAVKLGRWGGGAIGLIVYSADDVDHATWEVENWHAGALKWQTDGAQGVRDGKVTPEAWGAWGIRLSESAREIASRLQDAGLASRTKQFVSTMPAAFGKTVATVAKGTGSIATSILGEIPWWVWGIGGIVAFVVVAGTVTDTVKVIRGTD